MRKCWLILIVLLVATGSALWWFRAPMGELWRTTTGGVELGLRKSFQPDPKTYAVLASELERWRADLAKRHTAAKGEKERKLVENAARGVLEKALPEMMRCWLGTPWDFNGTAAKPGGGRIACGYFVATVLQDAGFKVDRYQLAQQPSANILRSFLPKDSCKLTIGQEYETFASALEQAEPGIYLVGLDTHVGFIVVEQGDYRMIHSSGSRPWCVVDETREKAHVLEKSNWRMLGNLTGDSKVIKRWLKADKIAVEGT